MREDEPRYFDVLTYLRNGTAALCTNDLADFVAFTNFCNKYDIGELAAAAASSLEGLLKGNPSLYIAKDETSIFAAFFHPDNPVLRVIYRSYIERLGKPGAGCGASMVRDLIAKDGRIALGIMRQLTLKVEQMKQGRPRTIFELSSDSGSSSQSFGGWRNVWPSCCA